MYRVLSVIGRTSVWVWVVHDILSEVQRVSKEGRGDYLMRKNSIRKGSEAEKSLMPGKKKKKKKRLVRLEHSE